MTRMLRTCRRAYRTPVRGILVALAAAFLAGPAWGAEPGSIRGQVFDRESGEPLPGATVILVRPPPDAGGEPSEEIRTTGPDGAFAFPDVPAGRYELRFHKAGYEASTMADLEVRADQVSRADFPLPPRAEEASDEILQLDAFVVEQSTADESDLALELRMQSDELVNTFTAEDFSKFSAGDVADALERVVGVTVADGQFAVIRGLEDRYNSTLYNGAPIPSPDPDKQSVQLDLFPSDVVSNLVISKTFSGRLPSNSSGGAIDIRTHDYPETFEFKVSGGVGYNTNAHSRFVETVGSTDSEKVVEGIGPFDAMSEDVLENGLGLIGGSPIGEDLEKNGDYWDDLDDVLGRNYDVLIGGRKEFEDREYRFKVVLARGVDYETKEGFQEEREPQGPIVGEEGIEFIPGVGLVEVPGQLERSGDLSLGRLGLSAGRFDFTESKREEQRTAYVGAGFDLDTEGNHQFDASFFWTRKSEERLQLRENGFLPGFDYEAAVATQLENDNDIPSYDSPLFETSVTRNSWVANSFRSTASLGLGRGALVAANFADSRSFERERELQVFQVNGDHRFERLPGLNLTWAWNHAETTQEDVSLGMRFFYEPCGFTSFVPCPEGVDQAPLPTAFPATAEELGPGRFAVNDRLTLSANTIEEVQDFYRVDGEYETDLSENLRFTLSGGVWREEAERDVASAFLESPTTNPAGVEACTGEGSQFACTGETAASLGRTIFDELRVNPLTGVMQGLRQTTNLSTREVDAWHIGAKTTFWDRLDVLGGVRQEHIVIESRNDPFVLNPDTGEVQTRLDGPQTFPSRFLFFDRVDTADEGLPFGADPTETIFNDQILGIDVPVDPETGLVNITDQAQLEGLVNGRIDERNTLPSASVALRPFEGVSLRAAWSETVARPSFRELGYYVTVDPGTDDLWVGNPQLQLSEVESYDTRAEYVWGPYGDLVAVSSFWKRIKNPIESIVIRDPLNFEEDSNVAIYRTFFNNPNEADLWGIEAEARKSFGFLSFGISWLEFLNHLSLGGNYTYIDAEVARTEAELARSRAFFGVSADDTDEVRFEELAPTRRLFNQPEWIANADLTFDHPDWGTRITLAWFAISSVLDAAGTAQLAPNGEVRSFTLDRYVESYDQLDLIVSQTVPLPRQLGELTFKFTAKNLTDSERGILYDPEQTFDEIEERAFKIGSDYSVSLTYTLRF